MDQDAGYIRLYRKAFKNFLWTEKRQLSRFEAWLDLLAEAWYGDQPGKMTVCGRVLTVNRGEVLRSLEGWAERWGWSKTTVTRFILLLENEQMIVHVNECRTSRILIVNYDLFNLDENEALKNRNENGTLTERQAERPKHGKSTVCNNCRNGGGTTGGTLAERSRNARGTPIKEEGKKERINNAGDDLFNHGSGRKKKRTVSHPAELIPAALRRMVFYRAWISWHQERRKRGKPMTDRAAKEQLKELSKWSPEDAAAMIRQSIKNSWTGIFELKKNNNQGAKRNEQYRNAVKPNTYHAPGVTHALPED